MGIFYCLCGLYRWCKMYSFQPREYHAYPKYARPTIICALPKKSKLRKQCGAQQLQLTAEVWMLANVYGSEVRLSVCRIQEKYKSTYSVEWLFSYIFLYIYVCHITYLLTYLLRFTCLLIFLLAYLLSCLSYVHFSCNSCLSQQQLGFLRRI